MAKVITTELQHSGASAANITLDSSKNVTCENNLQVDGNVTVTGTLPADKLTGALPAISGASLTGVTDTLSFRNLIINGAMQVNQRGTVTDAGTGYGGPDRWKFIKNDGAMTISQDTDVPTGQGFGNSYKIDCTSVAGTAGVQYVHIVQYIEGQDLQRIKKGTANAEQLTLSFWIKSTKTGTYVAELYDQDNNRHSSKAYTVSTTNTWEKKTITYAADTTGAFTNDNTTGLRVILWFYAGSSFQGGTLAGTWASNTDANRAEGQVNAFDNTANNVFVTGVQLEIGDTATGFEHRTWHDEFLRCQRYYWQFPIDSERGEDLNGILGLGHSISTTELTVPVQNPVYMRVPPTLENVTGMTNTWNSQHGGGNWGTWTMGGTWGTATNNLHSWVKFTGSGATSDESVLIYRSDSATESVVGFDSEI